jgi:hypothetical protein
VTVGSLLAVISFARVELVDGKPKLTARSAEVWRSSATLFVTQEGFPWGRAIFDETVRVESGGEEPAFIPRFGDPGRYSGLATLYTELAKSDAVRRAFRAKAPPGVSYQPDVVKSSDGGSVLPMIYMTGLGPTPALARAAANVAADEFRLYLADEQARAQITRDKRVAVVVIRRASPAEILEPRSIVRPIFLFLLVLMASVALAFMLENLRPSARRPGPAVVLSGPEGQSAASTQRSA